MTEPTQPRLFKPDTAARVEQALRLYADGWKVKEICRTAGISSATLSKALHGRDPRRKAVEPPVQHTPSPTRSTLVRTLAWIEHDGVPWPGLDMLIVWERLLRRQKPR